MSCGKYPYICHISSPNNKSQSNVHTFPCHSSSFGGMRDINNAKDKNVVLSYKYIYSVLPHISLKLAQLTSVRICDMGLVLGLILELGSGFDLGLDLGLVRCFVIFWVWSGFGFWI